MLRIELQDHCPAIYVPCLLVNMSTGQQCTIEAIWDTGASRTAISEEAFDILGLTRGEPVIVSSFGGETEGWSAECLIALTDEDQWLTEVDVLPELPVHAVIGMDIISDGDFSLTYKDGLYTFFFEQLEQE